MAFEQDVDRALHFGLAEAAVHETTRGELEAVRNAPLLGAVLGDLAVDVLAAERLLRMQTIVRATPNAQVRKLVLAARCARDHVIDLQERRRGAAMPLFVVERAALSVTLEHGAAERTRDARSHASRYGRRTRRL